MKYASIYKNGRPDYFFLQIEKEKEFAIIQPYFIATSIDHPAKGNIKYLECLFSGSVWHGKQKHGYGYSASADVYGTLLDIIGKMHKGKLSDGLASELNAINTHDDQITLSDAALDELDALNAQALAKKYGYDKE